MTNKSILVVDDDDAVRHALACLLKDEGYKVSEASRGREGVNIVLSESPDLVFLDVWMAGLDGLETLQMIKRLSPSTRVVIISGHASLNTAVEASRLGAEEFLEKPLDLNIVLDLVSGLLEKTAEKKDEDVLSYPDLQSSLLAGKNLGQRTLSDSLVFYGQGLHSGKKSGLVLEPLPLNSGIHFRAAGGSKSIPAHLNAVNSTAYSTALSVSGNSVSTIEHLMAALHAAGISNLLVKCDHEVPILDGSSIEFVNAIGSVGLTEQGGDWFELVPSEKISFETGREGECITLEPAESLTIDYTLNYPEPVGSEFYSYSHTGLDSFKDQISEARTFGFVSDIEKLQKAGLAAGGRMDNFIMLSETGVVNTKLRYENELCRHKILDAMGDLFLLGRPLCAKVTASMTGHSDNVNVLKRLSGLLS